MIEKILVAFDGSAHSDKALDFALDIAKKYSAQVVLINVIPFSPISDSSVVIPYGADYATHYKELRVAHEKLLAEALNKAKTFQKTLEISKKLVEGRPADKIVETGKEGIFDLIVIGSRGLSGTKKFFLGSVSNRVADKARCPVLIVK